MGLISSSASSASSSASVTSLLSPVGIGIGGVVIAALLVVLLAYLDVISVQSDVDDRVRKAVVAAVVPLGFTFSAIVVFRTMQLL